MDGLKEAILSNFLFIWVDAIFFKKQGLKAACNYLDEINVPYSVYKIDYVFNYGSFLEVKSTQREKEKEEVKPRIFFLKKDRFDLLNE